MPMLCWCMNGRTRPWWRGWDACRRSGGHFALLFHDTHHRAVSDAAAIADLALQDYDAVLAFGEVLRQRYLRLGWGRQVFTWHEAADTRLFRPMVCRTPRRRTWCGSATGVTGSANRS